MRVFAAMPAYLPRLIPPAMQHGKQPFRARLELLARLTLNTRNYAANASQLDWLSSTTAMIVLFWSRATRDLPGRSAGASRHSIVTCSDEVAISLYLWRALGWIVVS
jgi:hypothetical protein